MKRQEKLRAGIALVEMAIKTLEQAQTEFGGEASDLCMAIIESSISSAKDASKRAAYEYDHPESGRNRTRSGRA